MQYQQNTGWQPQQAPYQPQTGEWRQPTYEQPAQDMQEYYTEDQVRYAAQ
jgi:hypothetical protein